MDRRHCSPLRVQLQPEPSPHPRAHVLTCLGPIVGRALACAPGPLRGLALSSLADAATKAHHCPHVHPLHTGALQPPRPSQQRPCLVLNRRLPSSATFATTDGSRTPSSRNRATEGALHYTSARSRHIGLSTSVQLIHPTHVTL